MKVALKLFVALGLIMLSITVQAEVDSTDVLIKKLVEKQVITQDEATSLRKEIANTKEKEDAVRRSSTVTSKSPLRISGYGQVRYTYSDDPAQNLNLEIKRLRLTLASDITPIIDYKFQIDLAGSKKAVTSVTTGKTELFGKPMLLDAIAGIKLKQGNKLTVGQFYVPFGLENITSDSVLDTINRSQTTEKLVPGRDTGNQGRDIGIQIGGAYKFNAQKTRSLEYAVALLNGAGINTGDDNRHIDVAAHVIARPGIDGLAIGGSYYDGATGTAEIPHRRTGLELVYLNGPWAVKSEYVTGKDDVNKHGYYVTLVRNLSNTTQGVIRYDRVNANAFKAMDTVRPTKVVTLGLNWFLSKDTQTRLAVNYDFRREDGAQVPNDQLLVQLQTGF